MSDIASNLRYTADLDDNIEKTPIGTLFATEDAMAHRFEITVQRAGTAVDLTGCEVKGYFLRYKDKAVHTIDGKIEDQKAVVILDGACYAQPGKFSLVIKLKKADGTKKTVFFGESSMSLSETDNVFDENYVILDVAAVLDIIDEAETATSAANTAAGKANTAAGAANTAASTANAAATAATNTANTAATEARNTANTAAANANTAAAAANAAARAWGDSVAADSQKLGGKAADQYIALGSRTMQIVPLIGLSTVTKDQVITFGEDPENFAGGFYGSLKSVGTTIARLGGANDARVIVLTSFGPGTGRTYIYTLTLTGAKGALTKTVSGITQTTLENGQDAKVEDLQSAQINLNGIKLV